MPRDATRTAPPRGAPADLLFVFAGADWRKTAGLQAWREGAAHVLVLSVGRFEWRRVANLGLEDDGGLRARVEETPPVERHFFLILERHGARERADARCVARSRLGTWSEARALAALAAERPTRSVVVCTSSYHMPRALRSVRRALRRAGLGTVKLGALPVPEPATSPLATRARRSSPRAWFLLAREGLKSLLYAVILPFSGRGRPGG